jgi:hypothetical protein
MSRLHVVRAEMRLSRPDVEPLRPVALEPDPLKPFEGVFERCDPARRERCEVALDLLPLVPDERLRYRARHRKYHIDTFADVSGRVRPKGALGGIVDALRKDVMSWDAGGQGSTVGVPRNEAARRIGKVEADQVAHRITVPTALFYVQLLMRTVSTDRKRAYDHLYALLACWELWSGRNWFELVMTNFRLGYIGSNAPPRNWWFDYRFRSGRFAPLRNRGARVVALHDIAGWITPPPKQTDEEEPQEKPAPQAPPAPLPPAAETTKQMPPAKNADETVVAGSRGVFDKDGHLLLCGVGQRGATVDRVIGRVVARASLDGAGALVIEADGVERRSRLSIWSGQGRIDLPLLTDDSTQPVPGWNPVLPPAEGTPINRAAAVARALSIAAGCAQTGQAAALIDAAIRTLRALLAFLPEPLTPTLFQATRLIDDPEWRDVLLSVVDAHTRRFWFDVLPGLEHDVVRSVSGVFRRLGEDAVTVAVLGQPRTTYDPYPLLAAGRTVVVSGGDEPLDDVLAALLWFDACDAARTLTLSGSDPAPVVAGTAIHRYWHDREDWFAHDLRATVQSGTRVLVMSDQPHRMDVAMQRTIRSLATAIAVDTVDNGMDVMARWLGVKSERDLRATLDGLDIDECLAATAREGWAPRPLDARRSAGSDAARGTSSPAVAGGASIDDTRTRLDGLDDRIAEHLSAPAVQTPPADAPPKERGALDTDPNVISFDPSRRRKERPDELR